MSLTQILAFPLSRVLDHLDLRKEIEKHPTMAIELLRTLSRRLRTIEATVIDTLGSLLPICASCKRIREGKGSWTNIEEYISRHSDTEFSHGSCPVCMRKLYPEFADKIVPEAADKPEWWKAGTMEEWNVGTME